MSDDLATYAFLPWLRRGISREITRTDGTMTGEARAAVPITLQLEAAGAARPVTTGMALFGPGEVAALDTRAIIRTIPKLGELDAEPNYFPAVEFDQPDLPWRFTPARAGAKTRLRPWLVLAVLRPDEFVDEAPASGDGRLASIVVNTADALPRLEQSWAWAHVQVDGFAPATETLDNVVSREPHRVRSRLLAPRRLAARTAYRAFLVPAFERGRRAGLQDPLDETVDGLTPAWVPGAPRIRLPFYYSWSFQTGDKGDFETLARRLTARAVDKGVGLRNMDVGQPDPALPAAASGPLALEGALMSPAADSTPWPPAEQARFAQALAPVLNAPADALATTGAPRTVAPPLWVRWQAATDRFDPAGGATPIWFQELNGDPRLRAAAGLGAEVIRQNDQQLMAQAWDQVAGILEANAELKRAQLSRAASDKLLERHVATLPTEVMLAVTAPMHSHFTMSPVTAHEMLRRTPIPAGALGGAMRRVLRPAGAIGRRMKRLQPVAGAPLLARLNLGTVRARPAATTPDGMVSDGQVKTELRTKVIWWWLLVVLLALLALGLFLVLPSLAAVALALGVVAAGFAWQAARTTQAVLATGRVLDGSVTSQDVHAAQAPPGFVPAAGAPGAWTPSPAADPTPATPVVVTRLQAALADLVGEIHQAPVAAPELIVADLPAMSARLLAQMSPRDTIPASIAHRLTIADWVTWTYGKVDPLEPIMAAPVIDTPMYRPLKELSQSWLMPGVETIPANTATLLVTNQRFIEAYMAGLSHEMARELLYHEYPTDQQGTYFQHFWDTQGALTSAGAVPDPKTLRDIRDIHTWSPPSALGTHTGRTPAPRDGHLVLMVKGQILLRYPETMVYATRTVIGADGARTLGSERKFPIFEGHLAPDIAFFGFDLLPDEVRGNDDPTADQGWYLVLQERPGEPVFGLDPDDGHYGARPGSWNDLAWSQLAGDGPGLNTLGYIDLNAQLPDTTAVVAETGAPQLAWHGDGGLGAKGSNGSDLAYITLQRPFRVAIHGSDMLPPSDP
jgi:hypothetical protein